MKKLTETMKTMLDALAFADAGEYLTGREKARILGQTKNPASIAPMIPEPAAVRARQTSRRVALYLGSELPSEVMDYVIKTCARLQHELTVLTFESENTGHALLEPYEQVLAHAGVDMEMVVLSGDPMFSLRRYLRSHPEIAFLTCKETGYIARKCLSGTQSKNALPVPVVVVTVAAEGAASKGQPAADTVASQAGVA